MIAAWDWHMPRNSDDDERALVTFAHDVGFDTLILHAPTSTIMEAAAAVDIKVVAIVTPNFDDDFAQRHPDALQVMLPAEEAIAAAVRSLDWDPYTIRSHRWFSPVQMAQLLCFEHPASREELKSRVEAALAVADGVAFDGFGFANHYACYCSSCEAVRRQRCAAEPERHEAEIVAAQAEQSLVDISRFLFSCAKAVNPTAIVTNHVWPPFRPNPYYGSRLKLDYCSQTISWFFKPNWSPERVEFEAREMKRLEEPENNRFVPFIGIFDEPYLKRTGERIGQEVAIALQHGEGHLVFCTLQAIQAFPDVRAAVEVKLHDAR